MNNIDVQLNKIIYFDEESVTDYVQIVAGGQLVKTTELLNSSSFAGNGNLSAGVSIGDDGNSADKNVPAGISKFFMSLIGFKASASADASMNLGFQNDNLVRNILQNTILTDFLSIINKKSKSNNGKSTGVRLLEGYQIKVIKDSLSSIIMISPLMTMVDSSIINNNSGLDYDISIEKMDSAIKMAKGYFEFLGSKENDSEDIILRFNIDAFKNNYKISDLLKMELVLYAIRVGKTTLNNMTINATIAESIPSTNQKVKNPEYKSDETVDLKSDSDNKNNNDDYELDIYDVLLAGIRERDNG